MSTITLSCIPDLTTAVSAPRVAAIEHPLGYLLGQPDDRTGQLDVLRATLEALVEMEKPGSVAQLPFEWPVSARRLNSHPPQQPPISKYLLSHPWHIPNLFSRDVPKANKTQAAGE